MVKDIRKQVVVCLNGYEALVHPNGTLGILPPGLTGDGRPPNMDLDMIAQLKLYADFILEVALVMEGQSLKPDHAKRTKGGHTFDQEGRMGRDACKCGLSLYDWKCTWLWS